MQPIIANGFACIGDGVIDWRAAHGPAVGEPEPDQRRWPIRGARRPVAAEKSQPLWLFDDGEDDWQSEVAAQRDIMKRRARLCLRGDAIVYCSREKAYRFFTPTELGRRDLNVARDRRLISSNGIRAVKNAPCGQTLARECFTFGAGRNP